MSAGTPPLLLWTVGFVVAVAVAAQHGINPTRTKHRQATRLVYKLSSQEKARNPNADLRYFDVDGKTTLYEEVLNPREWLLVGHIPVPRSWLGWFVYHLIHGLWMRYPIHKVVLYSLFNSTPGSRGVPEWYGKDAERRADA